MTRKRSATPVRRRKVASSQSDEKGPMQNGASQRKQQSQEGSPSSAPSLSPFFFFSIFIDLMSVALVVPLLSQFTRHFGISRTMLGAVQAIYGGMQTISTPILGTLADKVGKRPVLVGSLVGSSVSYFIAVFAVVTGSVPLFIFSRVLIGAIRQTMSTGAALVADRYGFGISDTTAREMATAKGLSRFQSAAAFGFVIGPAVGGYVADVFGLAAVTAASATLNGLNAMLMYAVAGTDPKQAEASVNEDVNEEGEVKEHSSEEKRKGKGGKTDEKKKRRANPITLAFNLMKKGGSTASLLAGMYFFSLSYVLTQSTMSMLLQEEYGIALKHVGLLISAVTGANALMQAVVLPYILRFASVNTTVRVCMWLSVTGFFLQGWAPHPVAFFAGIGIVALTSGMADSLNKAKFSSKFVAGMGGEVMSVVYSIDGVNRVVAPLLGSYLVDATGVPLVPLMCACGSSTLAAMLVSFLVE